MSTYTDQMPDCCMACIHSIPRTNTRPQEFDCNLKKGKITWSEYDTPKECPLKPLPSVAGLRPCLIKDKKAVFHRWTEFSEVIAPSMLKGGTPGGEIKITLAIIEYEDGSVHRCYPEEIKFLDRKEDENVGNESRR